MTHPTIAKKLTVQLARKAGFSVDSTPWFASLERFAESIYKLGRNAGLEAAKQVCIDASTPQSDEMHTDAQWAAKVLATQIESLKDNTP